MMLCNTAGKNLLDIKIMLVKGIKYTIIDFVEVNI